MLKINAVIAKFKHKKTVTMPKHSDCFLLYNYFSCTLPKAGFLAIISC